jgi:hypothetical protein
MMVEASLIDSKEPEEKLVHAIHVDESRQDAEYYQEVLVSEIIEEEREERRAIFQICYNCGCLATVCLFVFLIVYYNTAN